MKNLSFIWLCLNEILNANQALHANVSNDKKIIYSDMQTITSVLKSCEW